MNKPKNRCYACGNNPISHFSSKMEGLLEAPLSSIHKSLPGRLLERGVGVLLDGMILFARTTGMIKFNDDINDQVGDRAKVIWEEATRRGIPMRQLVVGKIHTDRYEATVNGKSVYFLGLPVPEKLMRKSGAYAWINDKSELKTRLLAERIPAPQGGKARTLAQALKIFERIRKPVIVKPTNGSRGRHTTTFIYTTEQLREAFRVACQIAHEIIVEEHLIGSVYRGTVVGGKLVGVLRGDPPRITGDGVKTITELIEQNNKVITPLTASYLARVGYTLESILEKDKRIDLTEKVGVSYGGTSAEEFPICHPKTKALLEAAGRIVDLPVMGFDFIIRDIEKDPDEQIWGIIECNAVPFIDLHHHPASGEPINVAKHVWDLWDGL